MKRSTVTVIAAVIFAMSVICACDPQETIEPESQKSPSTSAITTSTVKADAGATLTAATVATTATAAPTAAIGVMRHLPGTAITTATGKYVYLVRSNGTVSPFATSALATASGYVASMIITVSADELYCYGRGDQITAALPAPSAGLLADGTIVKEDGKSTVYIVSDGVAWSSINEATFKAAGYNYDTLVKVPAGTLASKVDAVGNCGAGMACLDSNYLYSCAQDDPIVTVTPITTPVVTVTPTVTPTATATTVATTPVTTTTTTTPIVTATPTVSATSITTSTPIATATATTITITEPEPTVVTTTVATATATATTTSTVATTVTTPTITVTPTATATATATVTTPTVTVTPTATATATVTATIDLSWVYAASNAKLCLNANYFAGGNKAVLLIWSGPGADAAKGPVVMQSGDRFCWDFMNRQKGLYTFWVDEPEASCSADICPRDAIPGNGAQYMTAPKATAEAHKWLHCEPTGCDGMAYWDGTTLSPMGD